MWTTVPFGDLYAEPSRNGLNRPRRVRGAGYKMVNMGELFAYDRIRDQPMERVPMNQAEKEKYSLKTGDLLFARQSLVLEGTGKCSIVLQATEMVTFESHLIRVRLNPSKAMPLFYYYYFASPAGKANIQSLVMQVAAAGIRGSELINLSVPYPPFPTQSKIAAILSAYDDLIENNTRRIEIIEEMSRAIYHEWFVKFSFPGHEKVRMVDSPLGKIPEEWGVRKLSELSQLTKEKFREDKHSDLPLLNMARMLQHTLLVGEMGCPEELSTSRILSNEDDILFGSIRPYLHKVALAPCQGVTNVSVLVIRPIAEVYKSLLSVLLSSVDTVRWADQHSTGTKMPVIKWDILQTMPVLLPDESILGRFHDIVYPMLQTIKMTCSRNRNLRRTRDLLLPKLISGELDVEDLDINTGVVGAPLNE